MNGSARYTGKMKSNMGPALESFPKPGDGQGKDGELWISTGKQALPLEAISWHYLYF